MNNTNHIKGNLSENFFVISNFIAYYFISIVCFIGFLINFFIMYLLKSKALKNIFYNHLIIKVCIDSLICLIGIGYFNNVCAGCNKYFYYEIIIYQWFITISTGLIFMISPLHEIYLITNRYLILKNRNNWIVKLNNMYVCLQEERNLTMQEEVGHPYIENVIHKADELKIFSIKVAI